MLSTLDRGGQVALVVLRQRMEGVITKDAKSTKIDFGDLLVPGRNEIPLLGACLLLGFRVDIDSNSMLVSIDRPN